MSSVAEASSKFADGAIAAMETVAFSSNPCGRVKVCEVGVVDGPQCRLLRRENRQEGGGEGERRGMAVFAFQNCGKGGVGRRQQRGQFKLVIIRGAGGQGEAVAGAPGEG